MALDFIYTSMSSFMFVGNTNGYDGGKYVSGDLYYPQELSFKGVSPDLYPRIFSYTIWNNHKILSSIKPTGTDTSGRPGNFLAQHLVLEKDEEKNCKAGPAWLLNHRNWLNKWEHKEVKTYNKAIFPSPDYGKRKLLPTWEKVFKDSWKTEVTKLTESVGDSKQKRFILFDPIKYKTKEDILELFFEALSRIPKEKRWSVTFSTFATGLHRSLDWQWMGIDINDEKAKQEYNISPTNTIELP